MFSEHNKLFTIGQFSAIHGVTKKTLMWYDEIGLLKPAVIGENGYRYYTYFQSPTLEIILMLRELNVSIPEILTFLSNRSAENMEQLLGEKITELNNTISNLKSIQQALVSRHQDMSIILKIDLSGICITEQKKSYLVTVPTTADASAETEIESIINKTKQYQLHRLHDAAYGSMISVESLYSGDFQNYSALYFELPNPASKKGLHIKPAGKYLRAFCKGSWDRLPDRYKEILAYAQKQGLSLTGYSYEMGINETVIDDFNDYITQIEIQIKSG